MDKRGGKAGEAEGNKNLPASSSQRLQQPLVLVLILKFLLLAKSSQMEFSGLTMYAIKMHI